MFLFSPSIHLKLCSESDLDVSTKAGLPFCGTKIILLLELDPREQESCCVTSREEEDAIAHLMSILSYTGFHTRALRGYSPFLTVQDMDYVSCVTDP